MAKHPFCRILLLAEATDEGMRAARTAVALASDEEALLTILAVVDTHALRQLLTHRIFIEDEMRQYEKYLEASARKQLDYLGQLAAKAGVEYRSSLQSGACHTSVLQEQKSFEADLLVMGSFRPSAVKTDLMAREKQLIVNEIPCPVLLVPAPSEETRAPL